MTDYYTPIAEARAELGKRQRNGLREEVEYLWKRKGYLFPQIPKVPDLAILARQISTARFEDFVFRELALKGGLSPFWLEGTGDIFVSASKYKRTLLNPYVYTGLGKGGPIVVKKRLATIAKWERTPLSSVVLDDGSRSVVDYHHELQDTLLGPVRRIDAGKPWKENERARDYYSWYLMPFLAHGILFEDFHGGESGDALGSFTEDVFEPSFASVFAKLGITPLIVRMPWKDGMHYFPATEKWDSYGVVDDAFIANAWSVLA
jgi:hypothetical protein